MSTATGYYKSNDPGARLFASPSAPTGGRAKNLAAINEQAAKDNYTKQTESGKIHNAGYRRAAAIYGPDGTNPLPTTGATTPSPGDNPTTLYSGNVDTKYIPDQNDRINDLSQTGFYNDQNGGSYYANGDYMDTDVSNDEIQSNPGYQLLNQERKYSDATTDAMLASIKSMYDTSLIPQQEAVNRAEEGGVQNLLFRYGANKTGSGIHAMGAVATHGLQAVANLRAQEQNAIAQAKQSQMDGNFALAEKQVAIAEGLRKEKQDRAKAIYDEMAKKQEAKDKKISDARTFAYQLAVKNNAPADVIETIGASENEAEAYAALGEYGNDPLDVALKRAQLTKVYQDINAYNNDIAAGNLSEAEIKAVDNSPQGKKVTSLGTLQHKLNSYRELVDLYGTAAFGKDKGVLDASFADLKIAYKTAAELGALQGPDIVLLEEALRPATYKGYLEKWGSYASGGGKETILANLDQASSIIGEGAASNVTQLFARNPKYRDSEYVNSIIDPLATAAVDESVLDNARPGQILRFPDGALMLKEADGSFTEL